MHVARKVALGAAAALALSATGCADFLNQLQAMQGQGQQDPGLTAQSKSHQAGVAASAEATQDAIDIARQGDGFRDAGQADYKSAHFAYRKALELEPRNTYVLVAEATAYLRQGIDEKFSNPDGSATTDAGRLSQAEKYFKRAKTLADKALQVNPNYGTAHFVLAEMYALQGDQPKALDKFEFIDKNKLIPEGHGSTFHSWRGYVKTLNGDAAGAKADLESAVELSEPFELSEYADKVLNPPKAGDQARQSGEYKAIVKAF